jgi:uncharacterized protein YabN with tetrapyrrole methylase and pyrophosphatase domain
VPHTVEEAYELADAARAGDADKLLDELGDVLFQVHFLALLLEERDAGSLAAVADACREKLIRRHPHVFGDVEAGTAGEVRRNWDEIKRTTEGREGEGLFAGIPQNLPALLAARKALRRAERTGRSADREAGAGRLEAATAALAEPEPTRDGIERAVGDALFAVVEVAAAGGVDPELALRSATGRFQAEIGKGAAPR